MKRIYQFIFVLCAFTLCAAQPLTMPVGGMKAGEVLKVSGEVTLREPDGPRGQFKHGFRIYNDSAAEWQKFYGVQFEVKLSDDREVELAATILRAQRATNVTETPVSADEPELRIRIQLDSHPFVVPGS